MSCSACRDIWVAERGRGRAELFDAKFTDCSCESSLLSINGPNVANADLLARIVVSPSAYKVDESMLIWSKIVMVYGAGLSFFRPGSTEGEVREAIRKLTEDAAEKQELVGAALLSANDIRQCGAPERFFCVYDTDAEEFRFHADVVGTWPKEKSKSQIVKARESRQRQLRDELQKQMVFGKDADELIQALRTRGFELAA